MSAYWQEAFEAAMESAGVFVAMTDYQIEAVGASLARAAATSEEKLRAELRSARAQAERLHEELERVRA